VGEGEGGAEEGGIVAWEPAASYAAGFPVSPETTLRNCGSPHLNISPNFIETHTLIVWHNTSRLFEEQFVAS
jgi:hypothetical protein